METEGPAHSILLSLDIQHESYLRKASKLNVSQAATIIPHNINTQKLSDLIHLMIDAGVLLSPLSIPRFLQTTHDLDLICKPSRHGARTYLSQWLP